MNENLDIITAITELYWQRGFNIQISGVMPLVRTISEMALKFGMGTEEVLSILKEQISSGKKKNPEAQP